MKKVLILAFTGLLLWQGNADAQEKRLCGADILKNSILAKYPQADQIFEKLERENVQKATEYESLKNNTLAKTTASVTIPVVFHIVLDSAHMAQIGGLAGVAQRVDSQIIVLNRDYNALNSDLSQVPAGFAPVIGSAQIKFSPAHRDPNGNATNGYELVYTTKASFPQTGTVGSKVAFSDVKYTTAGGANAWDPNSYLNIWVTNFSQADLLGITMPPSFIASFGIPAVEKGVILNYGAFGKRGPALVQYYVSGADRGRTLTHELGHYFELRHIWGDDDGKCPGQPGGADDNIADTPPQADATYGNPAYPKFDSCSATGNGIMFMNYMDYVNDASMHLFTKGQVTRMSPNLAPGGESYSLTTHPELFEWPTAVANVQNKSDFNVYPNPTSGSVNITFDQQPKGLKQIRLINMVGQKIKDITINGQANNNYTIDLAGMSKGIYFVQCQFEDAIISRKIVLQ